MGRRKDVVEEPVNSNIGGEGAEVLKAVFQGLAPNSISYHFTNLGKSLHLL